MIILFVSTREMRGHFKPLGAISSFSTLRDMFNTNERARICEVWYLFFDEDDWDEDWDDDEDWEDDQDSEDDLDEDEW